MTCCLTLRHRSLPRTPRCVLSRSARVRSRKRSEPQHERLGLGGRFLILGYREDATRIMSAFDIFTLSSHHEGLPVALMEALALDLPVVATAVGGIPKAVDGWPATLVAPADTSALSLALTEAAHRFPRQNSGRPLARFDISDAATRLAQLYRRT